MARSAARVIGAVVVAADVESMHANVVSIAVDPRYRRNGIALRLLYAALAQQAAPVRTVSLEVRADTAGARALYERLSFRVSRKMRGYYADGAAALEYRASIQNVLDACQAASTAGA